MPKTLSQLGGWAVLIYLVARPIITYGGQWELDDNFIPVTAVAPDGLHFRDGTEMDMVSMSLARSHSEGKTCLFILAVFAGIGIWGFFHFRGLKKHYEALNKGPR